MNYIGRHSKGDHGAAACPMFGHFELQKNELKLLKILSPRKIVHFAMAYNPGHVLAERRGDQRGRRGAMTIPSVAVFSGLSVG